MMLCLRGITRLTCYIISQFTLSVKGKTQMLFVLPPKYKGYGLSINATSVRSVKRFILSLQVLSQCKNNTAEDKEKVSTPTTTCTQGVPSLFERIHCCQGIDTTHTAHARQSPRWPRAWEGCGRYFCRCKRFLQNFETFCSKPIDKWENV